MIDFLKRCNISTYTIKELSKKYSSQLFNLNCNQDECIKVIEYLREIGINNVEELLINKIHLFYETKEDLIKLFSKHNILDLVQRINADYNEVDILFE